MSFRTNRRTKKVFPITNAKFSSTVERGDSGQFVETGTMSFEGRDYSSGGSYFVTNSKTGKLEGLVYASPEKGEVTDWAGTLHIPAQFGYVFRGNMGDRRRNVTFTYLGKKFSGVWSGIDSNQAVRVKERKS